MSEQRTIQRASERVRVGPKMTRGLAWAAWIFNISLLGAALTLFALVVPGMFQILNSGSILIAFAAFGVVGLLITLQRPQNRVGWLFLAIGIGTGMTAFSAAYTTYAQAHPMLPGTFAVTVLGDIVWPFNFTLLLVFLPLLFPNGRLLSPRWRLVAWPTFFLLFLSSLIAMLADLQSDLFGLHVANVNINFLIVIPAIAALISLILRFRQSRGNERQQMKWLTYGCAVMLLLAIGGILAQDPTEFSFAAAIICLPLSIGISILRYRLYDIDRLISRTLIYLLLSALLALTYGALVFGLQFVLQGIMQSSPVPIVISTLAAAALFQPLRRGTQNVIDRSFYRRRYNAEQVLTNFGATLRNELDLVQLNERLLEVVLETMQPEHVSLWLCTRKRRERNEMAE